MQIGFQPSQTAGERVYADLQTSVDALAKPCYNSVVLLDAGFKSAQILLCKHFAKMKLNANDPYTFSPYTVHNATRNAQEIHQKFTETLF